MGGSGWGLGGGRRGLWIVYFVGGEIQTGEYLWATRDGFVTFKFNCPLTGEYFWAARGGLVIFWAICSLVGQYTPLSGTIWAWVGKYTLLLGNVVA